MILKNGKQIPCIYIGDKALSKVYSGADLVWRKSRLPLEYQEVEWIEGTGAQWIDTGIIGNQDTEIEASFILTYLGGDSKSFLGARNDATTNAIMINFDGPRHPQSVLIDWVDYTRSRMHSTKTLKVGDLVSFEVSKSYRAISINGMLDVSSTHVFTDTFSTPKTLKILYFETTGNYSGNIVPAKIVSVVIRGRADFVPCYRRSDSKPGLYDLVSDHFFVNQGTGDFIAGADVN